MEDIFYGKYLMQYHAGPNGNPQLETSCYVVIAMNTPLTLELSGA
jgi:hypothetical protein